MIDWEDIEKALGFKLFYWQKTYLQDESFRRTGKTIAYILHDLLIEGIHGSKIDLRSMRKDDYRLTMYHEFYNKLTKAGIECREVIFP